MKKAVLVTAEIQNFKITQSVARLITGQGGSIVFVSSNTATRAIKNRSLNTHISIYWNLKDGDTWGNADKCRGCLLDEYMRKKKSYYTLEHLIKHEWNTCVTDQSNDSGY